MIPMSPEVLFITGLALSCAILCGLFFVFSNFAMKALSNLPSISAIAAMQAINKNILNANFLGLFLGSASGSALVIIIALNHWEHPASSWAIAGAVLFLFGCFLITATINVPLNNRLEKMVPENIDADQEWQSYLSRWQPWNRVRMVSTLLAGASFAICALKMVN